MAGDLLLSATGMAKEPKEKQRKPILVTMHDERYRVNLFFNRFHCEPVGEHLLLHFGLVTGSNVLAQYSTVLERPAIEESQESMLRFLGEAGTLSEEPTPEWRPHRELSQVEVCNIVQMSRTGEIGEIRLGVFSVGVAIEISRKTTSKPEVPAHPLALLRCDLEVQKHLLVAIYGDGL